METNKSVDIKTSTSTSTSTLENEPHQKKCGKVAFDEITPELTPNNKTNTSDFKDGKEDDENGRKSSQQVGFCPQYSQYILAEDRAKSFDEPNCPMIIKVNAHQLSEAGFFYTGNANIITCFCCGLTYNKWKPYYTPLVQHQKHTEMKCAFIQMVYLNA